MSATQNALNFTELLTSSASIPLIIKPSSLNYKISLRQAVDDFIKKESKIDEYALEVQEE
jgi:hypothetical protein